MTREDLIQFEDSIVKLYESGKVPYPIHFSGGNEDQLIKIFSEIKKDDWIFSTWRSHYHYLLKGGDPEKLRQMILRGDSIHVCDSSINFLSSAIVGGCPSIAAGVAMSLRIEGKDNHVWCFIGDGGIEQGSFYEAVRFVDTQNLPCTFVIEDNQLSVDTPLKGREPQECSIVWPSCVKRYVYVRKWPHVQTGKFIKEYM